MRILIFAEGAENPSSKSWREIVEPIRALGHYTWCACPQDARTFGYESNLAQQLTWAIADRKVDTIIHAGLSPEDSEVLSACIQQTGFGGTICESSIEGGSDHPSRVAHWEGLLGKAQLKVRENGPKVSYLLSVYNNASFLPQAVDSILESSRDAEVVLVDDGSKDDFDGTVDRYGDDPRVRVHKHDNIGQTGRIDWSFRTLQEFARGRYVALLGADDVSSPERHSRQVAVLDSEPEVQLVHSGATLMDGDGNRISPTWRLHANYNDESFLRLLCVTNFIGSPSIMFRRSLFDEIGDFAGGFAHDYQFYFRTCRRGRTRFLPMPLVGYRQHDSNASIGAGADRGAHYGAITRRTEREKLTIHELYPSLALDGATAVDIGIAHLDLAMCHMQFQGEYDELAIAELERATEVAGDQLPEAFGYLAKAHNALGDYRSATVAMAHYERLGGQVEPGTPLESLALPTPSQLSTLPYRIADPENTLAWDGAKATTQRLLFAPLWDRPQEIGRVVGAYLREFTSQDDCDLAITTNGISAEEALARISSSLPRGFDLDTSASLTLEDWPNLDYVNLARFAGVVQGGRGSDIVAPLDQLRSRISEQNSLFAH